MKSVSRSILDAYNLLLRLCGSRLRVADAGGAVGLQERRVIVPAGSRSDDNSLENRINGPACSRYEFDWPAAELFACAMYGSPETKDRYFCVMGSSFRRGHCPTTCGA